MLDAPPDHWAKAELVLENLSLEQVNYVAIVITGKDQRFWQGNFGSKVADCSIRILWDENNTNVTEDRNQSEGLASGIQQQEDPSTHRQTHELRPQQEQKRNWLLFDLLLPILCVAVLTWLAKAPTLKLETNNEAELAPS